MKMIEHSQLVKHLSSGRLSRYESYFKKNKEDNGIKLYLLNKEIAGFFLGAIALFEVSFRNILLYKIQKKYPNDGFYNQAFLRSLDDKNKDRILFLFKDKKHEHIKTFQDFCADKEIRNNFSQDLIVSRLSLSFWRGIFATPFWSMFLKTNFPGSLESNRSDLKRIERLRNRICHHEFISNLDELKFVYDRIKKYICSIGGQKLFLFFIENTSEIENSIKKLEDLLNEK